MAFTGELSPSAGLGGVLLDRLELAAVHLECCGSQVLRAAKLRCALSRCSTGQVNWWFVLRRGRQSRGPRSTYLLLRLLLKNVRRIRLVNRAAHEPPAIRVVWPGYLTNTAPAPCRAAIFSRRVSKRLPVSRLASTQGWRADPV